MPLSKATVTLRGWVGRDAEMRYTPKGDPVASFSLAVSRGQGNDSDWFRVSVWGKLAEWASEYVKGRAFVSVEGRLERREWVGQDGVKHHDVEVVAGVVDLLARPTEGQARAGVPAAAASATRAPHTDLLAAAEPFGAPGEEIPF